MRQRKRRQRVNWWVHLGNIIDGKALAARCREGLKRRAEECRKRTGRSPGLGVLVVGSDPASAIYVRNKERACQEVGLHSRVIRLPDNASEEEVLSSVHQLNGDPLLDGVIVQLPLPPGIDATRILEQVSPTKDVDGLHPLNAGRLMLNQNGMVPCTPRAVVELLDSVNVDLAGCHVVIVGRSALVGKPLAALLLTRDATVTVCHSHTRDLGAICRTADVVVSAAGRPGLITKDHVKPGAVVIDVGTTRVDGHLMGDVNFSDVIEKASWITPVPGGVGPMTVTMLLANTLDAFET